MSRRVVQGVGAAALLLAMATRAVAAVPEDEAVEAYVAAHAGVRQARTELEAARNNHERVTKIVSAPVLAISGTWGLDARETFWQGSAANGGVTLTWSPAVPLSLEASLRHGTGLTLEKGSENFTVSGQNTVASLEAAWTLWPPPALQSRSLEAESARLRVQQAEYAFRTATEEARLEGRRLYVAVQVAAARLSVAKQRLSLAENALARAVDLQRAGLLGEDGVLKARSAAQKAALAVQQAAASLSGFERQLRLPASRLEPLPGGDELSALARRASEEALRRLTLPGEELTLPPLADPSAEAHGVVKGLPPLSEGIRQAVLDRAFEVRQAEQELELARLRLESVRHRGETAKLSASTTSSPGGTGSSAGWSVSLSAGLDLFDGGERRLAEADAALALAEAERAVADARERVRQELETRWQDVATAALGLFSARVELDVAEFELRNGRSRHERGVASADAVAEAEIDRADA
ncbi:MAG: TolC family protein, partial [Bacillota bacterium]